MAFDRNANNPRRLIRQSQRMKGGTAGSPSMTGSVVVAAPLDNTGNQIQLDLLPAGGLSTSSQQLAILLNPTTPGLSLSTSGLKFLIDPTSPGLTVSATGVKVLLNGSTLSLAAGGLSISLGGVGLSQLGALTTKGDLLGFTTNHVRVPVGITNGMVLTVDSTNAAGFAWAAPTSQFTTDLKLNTAGNGIYIKEGTNATSGLATLVGGTVTVSTTKVTASSRIFLTGQNNSGTAGVLTVSARVAGTSFTILSNNALDTRDVAWCIIEPA